MFDWFRKKEQALAKFIDHQFKNSNHKDDQDSKEIFKMKT